MYKLSDNQNILDLGFKKAQVIIYLCDMSTVSNDYFYLEMISKYPQANVELCPKEKRVPGKIKLLGTKGETKFVVIFTSFINEKIELDYIKEAFGSIVKLKNLKSVVIPYKLGCESEINDNMWLKYKKILSEFAKNNQDIKLYLSERNNRLEYLKETKEWSYKSDTLLNFIKNNQNIELFPKKSLWYTFFNLCLEKKLLEKISIQLEKDSKTCNIFPPLQNVFKAFELCSLENMKVLILGQDPYQTSGAATGLAFSHHPDRNKIQPSLLNIHKELINDGFNVDTKSSNICNLDKWACQGVFLLNTALSVKEGLSNSHKDLWTVFTKFLLNYIAKNCKNIVVILWGGAAKKLAEPIFKNTNHKSIFSAHPSPMSAHLGFFGKKPFSQTNNQLQKWGLDAIDWSLP